MEQIVEEGSALSYHCFRDFVVGYSISDIGKRHNLRESVAERLVRRGLYDFGFSARVLASIGEGRSRIQRRQR